MAKKFPDQTFISKRARSAENWEDFLVKYMYLCNDDEYDPKKNPSGYVNLGTAVNNMCNDIVHPKITDSKIWHCETTLLQYREGHGILRLRKALANLMTIMLKTNKAVDPDDLFCAVGVTGCIDLLAHCLADPGDVILTPTPVYGRIKTDLCQRSLVEMWPISIITEDNDEKSPQLTLEKVKKSYAEAKKANKSVRGILLLNPNNPLGDVYSVKLVMDILEFCHNHQLHAILDEVYALSVFAEGTEFYSVLSFSSLPDPERTHVLYGLSKDFSLAGLRIGVIHTKCKPLKKCLMQLTFFQDIPFPIMEITARLLEDLDWCKKLVSINRQRMAAKYAYCKQRLERMGLNVRTSYAGFFLWVDFREVCQIKTLTAERKFFHYLIEKAHLYIVPGSEVFCAQPGWFRISFTGSPEHVEIGLDRLEIALEEYLHAKVFHTEEEMCIESVEKEKENIVSLIHLLKKQIKESEWLTEHTAEKWIDENPELAKHFTQKKNL